MLFPIVSFIRAVKFISLPKLTVVSFIPSVVSVLAEYK